MKNKIGQQIQQYACRQKGQGHTTIKIQRLSEHPWLTKREHAAIEAMKGMLSSAPYWDMALDTVAIDAVEQADRLFNAIEEQK